MSCGNPGGANGASDDHVLTRTWRSSQPAGGARSAGQGWLAGDRDAHRSHTFARVTAGLVMSLRSSCDQDVKARQVRALVRSAARADVAGRPPLPLPLGGSGGGVASTG
jgi:hypothetical protein